MIATIITIAMIQPHIYATRPSTTAIAAPNEHVRVLGVELCLCRSPLRALLPKDRPASASRDARTQVCLQYPAASFGVVERRGDHDDEQSYHNPTAYHLRRIGDLSERGQAHVQTNPARGNLGLLRSGRPARRNAAARIGG